MLTFFSKMNIVTFNFDLLNLKSIGVLCSPILMINMSQENERQVPTTVFSQVDKVHLHPQ